MSSSKHIHSNKIQNARFISDTDGALGAGDRSTGEYIPRFTGNPHDSNNYIYRWQQFCHLYETSWEARKIIRIPVEDALRKEWIIEGVDDDIVDYIQKTQIRLKFVESLSRSAMLERLLGGCLLFMGIEDREDKPECPIKKSNPGKIKFVNSIPVSRITRTVWDNNPLSSGYMRARSYLINGVEVDVSRFLVFDGLPLFDPYDYALTQFRVNLAGFGPSVLAPIWEDIKTAVGTRQAAYQMVKTNNAVIAAVNNLQDLQGTSTGRKALELVKQVANQIGVYNAAVINGEDTKIDTVASKFGSVPELIITGLQVLSAASDIPATRFIGQAPGGLNATGEGDLENYYNMIDSFQRQRLEPNIRKFYDVICYEKFPDRWGKQRGYLTLDFPPLWNLSELEEAQRNQLIIDNIGKVIEAGLMTDQQAIEELNLKSVFSVELDSSDIGVIDSSVLADDGQEQTIDDTKKTLEGIKQFHVKNSDPISLLIKLAGGNPENIYRDQFEMGMEVEKEHSDITHGDKIETAKIVLAHLNERPDYYTQLAKIENKINLDKLPEPSQAQIESGNYKKHHVKLHGLDISIENIKGSTRKGIDPDGNEWECILPAHYGYIKRTEGADGDHVDVYIGDNEKSNLVYIVDQCDIETDNFDEHKCIIGVLSENDARELYVDGFSDGKGHLRILNITCVSINDFKEWLKTGDNSKPFEK